MPTKNSVKDSKKMGIFFKVLRMVQKYMFSLDLNDFYLKSLIIVTNDVLLRSLRGDFLPTEHNLIVHTAHYEMCCSLVFFPCAVFPKKMGQSGIYFTKM